MDIDDCMFPEAGLWGAEGEYIPGGVSPLHLGFS
jgi:hypothetical protein